MFPLHTTRRALTFHRDYQRNATSMQVGTIPFQEVANKNGTFPETSMLIHIHKLKNTTVSRQKGAPRTFIKSVKPVIHHKQLQKQTCHKQPISKTAFKAEHETC